MDIRDVLTLSDGNEYIIVSKANHDYRIQGTSHPNQSKGFQPNKQIQHKNARTLAYC